MVPEIQYSAIFAKISQKQPDFDISNILLLFLNKSHMFRIEWTLIHVHTTFGTGDLEFSHFWKKLSKNSQNGHIRSFSGFATDFFLIAVWFYIEMVFYLPFHWSLFNQIRSFMNLPKFTQMPNWWRHKGMKFWFSLKMTSIFGFPISKLV